jgi:large subunit ribosomal protein L25
MLSLIQNKKEMHILDLGLEDETESQAIIKDIQTDVLRSEKILHVDFQHVSMKEKVSVTCPLHIEGTPIGVSRDGGMLQHSTDSLSIECLPGDIPEYISVDVSKLEVGDTVHVRDLHEENIEITSSPDEIIASVTVPKREPTAEELAEQEAEEGAETPSDEQSEESGGQQQEQSE